MSTFDAWRNDYLNGKPPVMWPCGDTLPRFPIGPKRVVLLGGAPGAGKTTLALQLVFDALDHDKQLRAFVANVEMHPHELLNKQLSRFAMMSMTKVHGRSFDMSERETIEAAMDEMKPIADRVGFAEKPNDLANILRGAEAFGASLLVLDYAQRINPPGSHRDKRASVDALMGISREYAANGRAVLMLSAVGRNRDGRNKGAYDGDRMGLGSFKESSECEYGADDAFILTRDDHLPDCVQLKHLKSRYGKPEDLTMRFEPEYQRFLALSGPQPIAAATPPQRKRRASS